MGTRRAGSLTGRISRTTGERTQSRAWTQWSLAHSAWLQTAHFEPAVKVRLVLCVCLCVCVCNRVMPFLLYLWSIWFGHHSGNVAVNKWSGVFNMYWFSLIRLNPISESESTVYIHSFKSFESGSKKQFLFRNVILSSMDALHWLNVTVKIFTFVTIFFFFFFFFLLCSSNIPEETIHVSWTANQHTWMISEGSFEDLSNGCWKINFTISRIKHILNCNISQY